MTKKVRLKQPQKPGERNNRLVGFDAEQDAWLVREAKRLGISVTYLVTLLVQAGVRGRIKVRPPEKQAAA